MQAEYAAIFGVLYLGKRLKLGGADAIGEAEGELQLIGRNDEPLVGWLPRVFFWLV